MRLKYGALLTACIVLAAAWPLPPVLWAIRAPGRAETRRRACQGAKQAAGDNVEPAEDATAEPGEEDTRLTLKDVKKLRDGAFRPSKWPRTLPSKDGASRSRRRSRRASQSGLSPRSDRRDQGIVFRAPCREIVADQRRGAGRRFQRGIEAGRRKTRGRRRAGRLATRDALGDQRNRRRSTCGTCNNWKSSSTPKCADRFAPVSTKTTTHVVLLKDHAEYEAWCHAMFNLFGEQFDQERRSRRQRRIPVANVQGARIDWSQYLHDLRGEGRALVRCAATWRPTWEGCTSRNWCRRRGFGPLETGFADMAEAVVTGAPASCTPGPRIPPGRAETTRHPRAWIMLVRRRSQTNKATPLGKLLQMDTHNMLQPHFAEG